MVQNLFAALVGFGNNVCETVPEPRDDDSVIFVLRSQWHFDKIRYIQLYTDLNITNYNGVSCNEPNSCSELLSEEGVVKLITLSK